MLRRILNKLKAHIRNVVGIEKTLSDKLIIDSKQFEYQLLLLGQLHANIVKNKKNINSLRDVEFKVFSQFGEDGIIQYIINQIEIPNPFFIEFGVQNYTEANTRFLLMNNNWDGLVIDGADDNVNYIKNDKIYYRHNVTAVSNFITKENINEIIKRHVHTEDVGLLNIDIDGNDYWIWKELNVVKPRVVVCEYNSLFGCEHSITVPYRPDFVSYQAHYSCLYFGTSIAALCDLAEEKGYDFIGCDSEGVDAFFVRNDISSPFKKFSAKEGFVKGKYRISRDTNGQLTYLDRNQAKQTIGDMPVYDIRSDEIVKFREFNVD